MDDKLKMNGGAMPRSRPASRNSYLFDRRPGASSFRGPPSVPESYRQWTQFSGMPTHAGSPSSLQQVLDSMDMPEVPSEYLFSSYSPLDGPRSAGVLPSETARTNHFENMHRSFSVNACPPQRQYTEQGWSRTELSQPSRGQSFEFQSPDDFEFSLPNCQHLPSHSHSSHISASHSFHFPGMSSAKLPCSLAADQPQAFPTDLSQTSPSRDFFGTVIDFSCPPPLVNNSAFPSSSSDHCHPLQPKYLPSLSRHTTGSTVSCFTNEVRQKSAFVSDEGQSSSQEVPKADDYFRGHINMGMSSRFIPFAGVGEALHASEPQHTFVSDSLPSSPGFPKTPRKIIRQHSEPVVSSTQPRESECVYLEAVERSNSFGPSGDVLKSQAQDHKEKCGQPPESRLACENLQSKVRSVASKPSYSDVAKSVKPKDAQQKTDCPLGKERDDAEHTLPRRKNLEASGAKSYPKPSHKSHMHSKPNRTKSISSDKGQVFVQPNSRYGLDHFEDVISNLARGRSHSSSAESLTSHHHHHHQHQHQHQHAEGASCKGSNRSVGSSPITVQEAQHGTRVRSGVTTALSEGGTGKHKEKSNDHDATKMQSGGPSGGVGSHQPASSAALPTVTPKAKPNRPFFDPKRIFQTKESSSRTQSTGAQRVKGLGEALGFEEETIVKETVLNNGKPNNNSNKVPSAAHKKADYINNDLRETGGGSSSSSKRTNQTAALNRDSHFEHSKKAPAATPNSDSHDEQNGSSDSKKRGSGGHPEKLEPATVVPHQNDHSLFDNFDWVLIDDWLKYFAARGQVFASSCFSAILTLLLYLFGIIMYLVTGMIHLMAVSIGKIWGLLKVKFFKVDKSSNGTGGWGNAGSPDSRRRSGLEENITLPATGEEAMRRLLACKGKDPYSILGLRFDATDDDVKRYYRKQAVLVHPDKNQEPGAEEAFKILGHAFEMIGEPAKRKQYDAHILEASEAEAAMREFSDLLTKLQEKIQEAANMMRCEQCGGKHRRVPVDRPWCSARYCDRCNIHHTAKEGDVWAETSMLGFLWHYYACMEGKVYDITEWVSCQRENFKHMKANAHPVFYRIQTDGNRRQRSGQSGEAHLEDFINQLFNKASMQTDGFPHPDWHPPGAGNQSSWGGASPSSNAKRTRRRKRKN